MATKDNAIEILKKSLKELESELDGKIAGLEKAKNEAYKAADAAYKEGIKQFQDSVKEVEEIKNALIALGVKGIKIIQPVQPVVGGFKPEGERVPFPIVNEYSKDLSFIDKVGFALKEIKSGNVDDVAAKLKKLEPKISEKSLKDLNQRLSGLYKKGKIGLLRREGRKYIYTI